MKRLGTSISASLPFEVTSSVVDSRESSPAAGGVRVGRGRAYRSMVMRGAWATEGASVTSSSAGALPRSTMNVCAT